MSHTRNHFLHLVTLDRKVTMMKDQHLYENETDIDQTRMFIAIADIDLFRLQSVHDFLIHPLVSTDQLKQLIDDNQGKLPLPVQLEQFVLDHLLQANSKTFRRETFRDESLIDLYTSFLNDLLQWPSLTHPQIVCMLTWIQGLLCQIERHRDKATSKVNEAFIHACSVLMQAKDAKRPALFTPQQAPKVIDYIVQTILQHQHLYQFLLDDQPFEIETIEETRTIDFHLFEKPLFPCPLIEGLPLSLYREVILQIPPTPPLNDPNDPNQQSRTSFNVPLVTIDEPQVDCEPMIEKIRSQYPHMTREQIREMFVDVAQSYSSDQPLQEKELSLLEKFKSLS